MMQMKGRTEIYIGDSENERERLRLLMRRILSFMLLLCVLSTACIVCAAESKPDFTEESWGIEPFSSKLVLDTSIAGKMTSWSQYNGYTAYRVWVENTTSVEMKVTVTDSRNKSTVFYVPSNGNKTLTNNSAVSGVYKIAFYTGAVTPSGLVRVRVSTKSLP